MRPVNKLFLVLSLLFVMLLTPVSAKTNITDSTNAPRVLITNSQSASIQETINPQDVYNRMVALKGEYYEGRHWTNDDFYRSVVGPGGYGCHAFALILSDAAFGNLPIHEHHDVNNIRVGDILRVNNNTHTVIVLEVHPDYLIIAEGNYNSSIHWGRKLNRSGLAVDFIWTRYPDSSSSEPSSPSQPEQPSNPSSDDLLEVSPKNMVLSSTTSPNADYIHIKATVSTYEDYINGVKFQSENPNVATVNSDGLVTAIAPGTTRISVQVGKMIDYVTVTVTAPATDIKLSSSSTVEFTLNQEPKTSQIIAETVPKTSSDTISYSSSDSSVATVSSTGLITSYKEGTAIITLRAGRITKTIKVIVRKGSTDSKPSTPTNPDKPSTPSIPNTPSETPQPNENNNTVPIYRLYNNQTGEHLYTPAAEEVSALVNGGWTNEGVGWNAPRGGKPIYRLYNPALADHLYTSDDNEVRELTTSRGWIADFGGDPIFYSTDSGTPIYRLYNGQSQRHLLTRDAHEYSELPSRGWTPEGVSLYGLS